MNIAELIEPHVSDRGTQPAVVEGPAAAPRVMTFADLDAAARVVAAKLSAVGVGVGDRVLVLLGMSGRLYATLLATFRLGAVATFVDPGAPRRQLDEACRLAAPRAVVCAHLGRLLVWIRPPLRRVPHCIVVQASYGQHAGASPARRLGAEAPALLTFTSGSTATPKAAVRTHGLLAAQHAALAEALELRPGTVGLSTLPIFALANLASGVTSVIAQGNLRRVGRIRAGPVLAQVARYRPAACVASPALFERLLAADAGQLKHLGRAWTGGAPVYLDLLHRLEQACGDAAALYGSTEAEPVAHVHARTLTPADADRIAAGGGLPAGRPVPQVRVAVVEPGSRPGNVAAATLPPGQPGEILVAGDHVLTGYLDPRDDAETKLTETTATATTTWHRTGDGGYFDEQGRLWLLGRTSAAVYAGGRTVWPLAVEAAARRIGGVRQCALVEHQGRVVLVACLGPGRRGAASVLLERLATLGVQQVLPVRHIPLDRRHNAKVDYPALRRMLGRWYRAGPGHTSTARTA